MPVPGSPGIRNGPAELRNVAKLGLLFIKAFYNVIDLIWNDFSSTGNKKE